MPTLNADISMFNGTLSVISVHDTLTIN